MAEIACIVGCTIVSSLTTTRLYEATSPENLRNIRTNQINIYCGVAAKRLDYDNIKYANQ